MSERDGEYWSARIGRLGGESLLQVLVSFQWWHQGTGCSMGIVSQSVLRMLRDRGFDDEFTKKHIMDVTRQVRLRLLEQERGRARDKYAALVKKHECIRKLLLVKGVGSYVGNILTRLAWGGVEIRTAEEGSVDVRVLRPTSRSRRSRWGYNQNSYSGTITLPYNMGELRKRTNACEHPLSIRNRSPVEKFPGAVCQQTRSLCFKYRAIPVERISWEIVDTESILSSSSRTSKGVVQAFRGYLRDAYYNKPTVPQTPEVRQLIKHMDDETLLKECRKLVSSAAG